MNPKLVASLVLHVIGVRPKLLLKLFAGTKLNFIFMDICNKRNFFPDEMEGLLVSILPALNKIGDQNSHTIIQNVVVIRGKNQDDV